MTSLCQSMQNISIDAREDQDHEQSIESLNVLTGEDQNSNKTGFSLNQTSNAEDSSLDDRSCGISNSHCHSTDCSTENGSVNSKQCQSIMKSEIKNEQLGLGAAFSDFITSSMENGRPMWPSEPSQTNNGDSVELESQSNMEAWNTSIDCNPNPEIGASSVPAGAWDGLNSYYPNVNMPTAYGIKKRNQPSRHKARDPTWLKVEICRDFQRGECTRLLRECRFAHPSSNCVIDNGKVTTCYDSLKFRCTRAKCKYYHPPEHIQVQIKLLGKSYQLFRDENEYTNYMVNYNNSQCMQYGYSFWLYPYLYYNSILYSNYQHIGSYSQYGQGNNKYLSDSQQQTANTHSVSEPSDQDQTGTEDSSESTISNSNNQGPSNINSESMLIWPDFETRHPTFTEYE